MWHRRLIAASIMIGMFAVPVVALARTEAPGGVRHTIEVHGQYQGCRWTGGWAQRVWRHAGTAPGPERDPNYVGKLWDFRCKRPFITQTVTATVTVPGGGGSTHTVTVTPSPSTSPPSTPPPPSCDPDIRSDDDDCED